MGTIREKCKNIFQRVDEINSQIMKKKAQIEKIKLQREGDIPSRIENLERHIEKIDEYLPKIKKFQELASDNLDSQNVKTIAAYPGYRVNLNRLKAWSMMIDPQSRNDAYAQRVYAVAKCDELFLTKKREEFLHKIEELKQDRSVYLSEKISKLQSEISILVSQMKGISTSKDMQELSLATINENEKFRFKKTPKSYSGLVTGATTMAPGSYAVSLRFADTEKDWLKAQFGEYFDADTMEVMLPFEIPFEKDYILDITCGTSMKKTLEDGLKNLILYSICNRGAGMSKVYVIDGMRYNSTSVGSLRKLEDSVAMAPIPRNPEQLTATLESITASFADMDEVLDSFDSVWEYNRSVIDGKKLPITTLIVYGLESSLMPRDRELMGRILLNYERYGISIISVSLTREKQKDRVANKIMPEYAEQNAIKISMSTEGTFITVPEGEPKKFKWYEFDGELPDAFVKDVKRVKREDLA